MGVSPVYLQVLLEHGVRQRLATGLPHDAMLVDAVDRDGRSVYELAVQSGSERCVARLDEWEVPLTLTLTRPVGGTFKG